MKLNIKYKVAIIIVLLLAAFVGILFLYAKITFGAKLEVNFDQIAVNKEYDVNIVKQEKEVTYLAKNSGENFKILAFTDMHFDGMDKKAMDKTINEFLKAMNKEHPDLVVFTGDIVTAIFNKKRAQILGDTMERYGVYWCAILGNHEGEHPLACSRKNLIKLWANHKKYPHSLVESGPDDIYGYGNYVVNLLNAKHKVSQSLIFMDSGADMSAKDAKKYNIRKKSYDYIKQNQINWYKEKIKELPKGTKSSLFIHIPLSEYATAWDTIYDKTSGSFQDTKDCRYISGWQREPVCCSDYNSGLFDVIKSLGSTQAVFCGHDHVNDYSVSYQEVDLNYLLASGYTTSTYGWDDMAGTKTDILEKETMQGYTILDINTDGEYKMTKVRYKNLYE